MGFEEISNSLHDASLMFVNANNDSLELRFTDFNSESLEESRNFLFSNVSDFSISSLREFELLKSLNDSGILGVVHTKNINGRQNVRFDLELFDYEYKIREFLTFSFEFSIAIDITSDLVA